MSMYDTHAVTLKQVVVEEIDQNGTASCVDQFGFQVSISTRILRSKGMKPAVGESWLIDRTIGGLWTFACVLVPLPPTVTGERDANPGLASLLESLSVGGLIIDETTEGTGGGGPGGGMSRSVVVTSGNVTAGATASTDYVYVVAGAHTVTLPTAVGNTNRYTIKNGHSASVQVNTTSSQTIDGGSAPISLGVASSIDLISDNTNWRVI